MTMGGRTSKVLATAVAGVSLVAGSLALGAAPAGAEYAGPDLGVTGSIPAKAVVGQPFTSRYTVTNHGTVASEATRWGEAISGPGVGPHFVSGSVGCDAEDLETPHVTQRVVYCDIPALQPGHSYQFQVTLAFDQQQTYGLYGAVVAPNETGGNGDDNVFGREVTATTAANSVPLLGRFLNDTTLILGNIPGVLQANAPWLAALLGL